MTTVVQRRRKQHKIRTEVTLSEFEKILNDYIQEFPYDTAFPLKRYNIIGTVDDQIYRLIRQKQHYYRGKDFFKNIAQKLINICIVSEPIEGLDIKKIEARATKIVDTLEYPFTRHSGDQNYPELTISTFDPTDTINVWSRGQPTVKFTYDCNCLCIKIKHHTLKGKKDAKYMGPDDHITGEIHYHQAYIAALKNKTTDETRTLTTQKEIRAVTKEKALAGLVTKINTEYNLFFNHNRIHPEDDRVVELHCDAPGSEDKDIVVIFDAAMLPYVACEQYQWQARKLLHADYYDIIHDPGNMHPIIRLSQVILDCNINVVPGFINKNPLDFRICNLIAPTLTRQRLNLRTYCENNTMTIRSKIDCDPQYADPNEERSNPFKVYLVTVEPVIKDNYSDASLTEEEKLERLIEKDYPGLHKYGKVWTITYYNHGQRTTISRTVGKFRDDLTAKQQIIDELKQKSKEANGNNQQFSYDKPSKAGDEDIVMET